MTEQPKCFQNPLGRCGDREVGTVNERARQEALRPERLRAIRQIIEMVHRSTPEQREVLISQLREMEIVAGQRQAKRIRAAATEKRAR